MLDHTLSDHRLPALQRLTPARIDLGTLPKASCSSLPFAQEEEISYLFAHCPFVLIGVCIPLSIPSGGCAQTRNGRILNGCIPFAVGVCPNAFLSIFCNVNCLLSRPYKHVGFLASILTFSFATTPMRQNRKEVQILISSGL